MAIDEQHLQDRLTALADKHGVVGASLAVALGEEQAVAATGVLNLRTGQAVTADSVFQVGSITKTWTATLVMQLVDEGLLDLDAPIVTYLPAFRVADDDLNRGLTTRHLLTHTSGLAGDFFPDAGRGDDCLERFVTQMGELGASHPLGATMSYCNTAFTVLGRLVEVVRGATWDAVMRERLITPLGLDAVGTLPEEALLWGTAAGHLTLPGQTDPVVAPQWALPRCAGPAGTIHARARDLVAFARLHLADGVAADGTRLLSERSAREMRTPQVEVPDKWSLGEHFGLAWILMEWDGRPVFGHDGGTIGQNAFLRILPATADRQALTIALLTNGGDMRELYQDLFDEIATTLGGVTIPPRLQPPTQAPEVDQAQFVGVYERESMSHEITVGADGRLMMVSRPSGVLAIAMGTDRVDAELVPLAPNAFLTTLPAVAGWLPLVFYTLDDGTRYIHIGGRASAKVA